MSRLPRSHHNKIQFSHVELDLPPQEAASLLVLPAKAATWRVSNNIRRGSTYDFKSLSLTPSCYTPVFLLQYFCDRRKKASLSRNPDL